ncbi:MAG TPA: hypothetical protein PLZ52_01370 [Bacteroidales bacterium]|nr:hypothetical protein [Bacteroidales bacterium]HQL70920.1 hypothetical protein [Bacteroidales bacterium]
MNKFVFVVCGGKEHIEELNFSLDFLRHYSDNEILVITDSKRNETAIEHNHIIDVETPVQFDNHQASIWLKTGLHKHLESGHHYCYLDGDVVAVSHCVDAIFAEYHVPVTFASDHCYMNQFSPHALNCNCLGEQVKAEQEKKKSLNEKLSLLFGKIDFSDPIIKQQSDDLYYTIDEWKKKPFKYFMKILSYLMQRYVLPIDGFNVKDYRFNKHNKCWYNSEGELILFDYPYYEKELWVKSGIRYNKKNKYWEDRDGTVYIFNTPECSHLVEYLRSRYNIEIPGTWQHWNGGVFLFGDESHEFLNFWHQASIDEFDNPFTKTRDQATLAMSVWRFGLQNHPRLPKKFNFITEFANNDIAHQQGAAYTFDGFKTVFEPCFLHVYHEWGTLGWSIWDSIIELGKMQGILKN